jgi:hypothetical protein
MVVGGDSANPPLSRAGGKWTLNAISGIPGPFRSIFCFAKTGTIKFFNEAKGFARLRNRRRNQTELFLST